MEKKEKAPVLRFKDTNGKDYPAWEQRKLEEITDVRDGTHDSPKYIVSGNPLLTSKNVKEGYINYDDVQFISDNDFEKINQRSKVDTNDILMGMIGTIGNLALIREEPDFAIKNVALIKDLKQANQYYIYSYLQSPVVFNQFSNSLAGGTQKFISLKNIRELNIAIPSIQEQEKIGLFFESLDYLITLHQRKLEALKKLKRTLLQKMFPKKGHLKPELRFFGFTNDWEQRKLGDIGTVQMNKRIFKTQTSTSGEIPFYKIGTFGKTPDAYISRELFEEYKKKYPYPKKGDLLLSASGSIGNVVEYNGEEAYFQDSNIVWLEHGATISNRFLKAFYSVVNWEGIEGTTIKRLYNKTILDTPITLPSFEEQEKIGNFFTVLDKVITLHQRKLEIYKKLKKGLLQKMFI